MFTRCLGAFHAQYRSFTGVDDNSKIRLFVRCMSNVSDTDRTTSTERWPLSIGDGYDGYFGHLGGSV